MNFLAFFQLVFLICRELAWDGLVMGRNGRTNLEMTRDWCSGKLTPWFESLLLVVL